MSRVPADAAAAANFSTQPGVLPRLARLLIHPRSAGAAVAATPRWLGVLACSTALAAAASGWLFSTDIGQLALIDGWERTAFTFGTELDDAEYAALVEWSEYGPWYGAAQAVLGVAGLSIAVSVAAFALLPRSAGRPTLRQVLAVVSDASIILALRAAMAAGVGYAREQASGHFSAADWLGVAPGSAAARTLGTVDLLIVWWAVVIAMGLAGLYGRPARRIVPLFVGMYVGLAVLLGGAIALLGRA